MKLGIVVYSNDSETVWNALRFANFALSMGDEVNVFLLSKGVECESIDTNKFRVSEELQKFVSGEGEVFACSTCLDIRQLEPSRMYTAAGLMKLYEIVNESDKTVTF